MSNIKVMHILEATVGGTARHLELVARYLPSREVDLVCVVSPVRNAGFAAQLKESCLPSDPDNSHDDKGNSESQQPLRGSVTIHEVKMSRSIKPLDDISAYLSIKRLIKTDKPDVVHTHSSKAGFLGRRAAHALGIPTVHTPHVFAMEWSDSPLYRISEKAAARWTDRLVALNEEQVQIGREVLGLSEAKIITIPNGVDPDQFYPATPTLFAAARDKLGIREMRPIIGMAARLEPQKGVGNFLRAARKVLDENAEVLFLIAGEGVLKDELKGRARELGIDNSIRFLGRLEHMSTFYHALDIFVLASLWEGMPYAILEAQASGLPVVASATPGAKALIDNEDTGQLAPVDDVDALAGAINHYLADTRLRERHGRKAREHVVGKHHINTWADSLAGLYREMV